DVHQHLWSEPLVAALAARRRPPRARRERDGWWLDLDGEAPSRLRIEDVEARAALVRSDGLDRALVALSGPLGVEPLPADEAAPLLDAHHEAVAQLPEEFGGWAAVALLDPDAAAAELERRLDAGFAGLCLPAGALATPSDVGRAGPLLAIL